MIYSGRVKNGVVVLDDCPTLPEGARIEVSVLEDGGETIGDKSVWDLAREIAESVPPEEWEKVPADSSVNLDHYLYGAPKCEA